MTDDPIDPGFPLFADLLEYPTPALSQQTKAAVERLTKWSPEAAVRIDGFQKHVDASNLEQMQELYTRTFDIQPVCYPYVGYHLFGESYKRGAFMAMLNEGYRKYGYSAGNELPDHVGIILRFLGSSIAGRNSEFGQTLLNEGLVPTLEKMIAGFDAQPGNPYAAVVSGLYLVITEMTEKERINV